MTCYDRDQGFMLSGLLPQSIVLTDGADPVNVVLVRWGGDGLMGNTLKRRAEGIKFKLLMAVPCQRSYL